MLVIISICWQYRFCFFPQVIRRWRNTLYGILCTGRKEGLTWLLECLEETLEDRQDEGGDEAIPLVPLTENAIAAMEDHTFLRFIAKMGLAPPANEQVSFKKINCGNSNSSLAFFLFNLKMLLLNWLNVGAILAYSGQLVGFWFA